MTDASSPKRHLAIWFPYLAADRLRQQEPDRCVSASAPPDAGLAFVAKQKNALRLAAVDAAAGAMGSAPTLQLPATLAAATQP